jgi:hypothetical protein
VIFSLLNILLLLLPKRFNQRIVFLVAATLYLVISGWFMLEQARFFPFMPEGNWLFIRLQMVNSLRSNTGKVLAIGFLASMIMPLYLVIRYEKIRTTISSFYERISTLSLLYLSLDLVSFVIVLLRID